LKNIGRAFQFALTTIGSSIHRQKPPQPPDAVASVSDLETCVNQLVAFGTPPGLSLVVTKDGTSVYNKSFGLADGPKGTPATPDTVYRWMSMTKIPTAIAILQLYERGFLDIERPVNSYLPFFKVRPTPSTDITIRHLLNHSSGLANPPAILGWIHHEGEPHLNQTELVKSALPDYAKLAFEPGTQAKYTNLGYMVLGAVIEAVSNQTYEEYVAEHILRPLGMAHTNFVYTDDMLPHAATGSHPTAHLTSIMLPLLIEDFDSFIRETVDGRVWFKRIYPDQTPPTGLIGPAEEAARLVTAYLNGGELAGARILSSETVDMMSREGQIASKGPETKMYPGLVHGLGWWTMTGSHERYLFHGGDGPGFSAMMRIYPARNLGITVFGNDWTYGVALSGRSIKDTILDLVASLDWE
jgi:D-alanyl-D-alanine carboxypeptidase